MGKDLGRGPTDPSCKFAGSPGEFIEPAKIKQKKLNSNA